NLNGIEELVTDKGYHSGAVVQRVKSYEVRSYIPEKNRPRAVCHSPRFHSCPANLLRTSFNPVRRSVLFLSAAA
ncbi:MAG: hypothetical protein ACXWI9_16185, partial [Burkholderiales bacterium]